ncbi:sulfotransferase family 2 domain-containing protein [Janibacter alittae]|uniref:Sulfotransferase family 2 domain-containing protein n=1 Tax=Janibacter alittae TaxID=3115209 RepID=A0ABZ2MHY1_9MICO
MPVFRHGERKFLFIHIPKTGGSSIERAFADAGYDTLYRDGRTGPTSWNSIRRCTPQHMHREMLESILRMDQFDGVFTVVRDPMARMKSEYLWRHRNAEFSIGGRSVEKWTAKTLSQYADDPFIFDNHIRPQVDYLVDRAEIFRFEDGLDEMATTLNSKWGLGLPDQLPRVREGSSTTKYASKDVEVTTTMRDLVGDFYREDYRTFGYTA